MRIRTARMMALLLLGAASCALVLAQTKTAEKDAPVAALAPPETPVREVDSILSTSATISVFE